MGFISLLENVNSYPLLYYSKTSERKNTSTVMVIISREYYKGPACCRGRAGQSNNKMVNGQWGMVNNIILPAFVVR
jgi:hypothetical protein